MTLVIILLSGDSRKKCYIDATQTDRIALRRFNILNYLTAKKFSIECIKLFFFDQSNYLPSTQMQQLTLFKSIKIILV